jgi:hypothetical protein
VFRHLCDQFAKHVVHYRDPSDSRGFVAEVLASRARSLSPA